MTENRRSGVLRSQTCVEGNRQYLSLPKNLGCMSLLCNLYSQLAYRCRPWHVLSPQQRTSAHLLLLCPSEIINSSVGQVQDCVVWYAVILFSLWLLCSNSLPRFFLWRSASPSLSVHLVESPALCCVCLGQVWECRFAAFCA